MIVFLRWLVVFLKSLWPFIKSTPITLIAIWELLKNIFSRTGAWMLIALEPMFEFLIELITGQKGPVSSFIQLQINSALNYCLSHITGMNIQNLIDQIPVNIMHFACYLGVTSALQILYDGIITAMVVIMQLEITILVFKIRTYLFLRMR